MKNDELTRRRLLGKLVKLSAALAGLGAAKISPLFAQIQVSKADLETAVGVGAQAPKAKAIKALLFPRDEVYRSEFGRLPTGLVADPHGGEKCDLHIQPRTDGGKVNSCNELICKSFQCEGLKSCETVTCGAHSGAMGSVPSFFSAQVLSDIMGDPFIKALCRALKVTTAQDLGSKLKGLLL